MIALAFFLPGLFGMVAGLHLAVLGNKVLKALGILVTISSMVVTIYPFWGTVWNLPFPAS